MTTVAACRTCGAEPLENAEAMDFLQQLSIGENLQLSGAAIDRNYAQRRQALRRSRDNIAIRRWLRAPGCNTRCRCRLG